MEMCAAIGTLALGRIVRSNCFSIPVIGSLIYSSLAYRLCEEKSKSRVKKSKKNYFREVRFFTGNFFVRRPAEGGKIGSEGCSSEIELCISHKSALHHMDIHRMEAFI